MALKRSAFLAAATAAAAAHAAPALAQSLTNLTVLFPRLTPGSDFSFLWGAEALGYFRDEGLDITVQPTGGSPEVARLLAAGQGDVGINGSEATIASVAKGLPLRDVFCIQQKMIYSMGAPETSAIRTAADFKGKRIGVQSLSASPVFVAQALLREAGLDPDRDVTFVPIGVGGAAVAAVKSGQVDGVSFHDTQFLVFRENGVPFRLLPAPAFQRYFTAGLVVKADAVGSRAPMIAGFCRAIAKGLVYSFANPAASIKAMTEVMPEEAHEKYALPILEERLTYEKLPPQAHGEWGWNTVQRYQQFADFLLKVGYIGQHVDAASIFTPQFLKQANAFDEKAIARSANLV